MKSRLTTVLLVMVLVAFGTGGAFAGASELGVVGGKAASKAQGKQAKKKAKKKSQTCSALKANKAKKGKKGKKSARACARKRAKRKQAAPSAAVQQYGTRPGKGCGDRNHVHTGPPGNPTNTQCPPQAGPKS